MDHAVMTAMLGYIDDLHRSVDINERFADNVVALAHEIEACPHSGSAPADLIGLARRHRVDAIKARARIEAVSQAFVRRFGVERFEQERAKRPVRPRRPI